ncbi:MAG: helix-turn-helix transcriptional regulator, partial [Solirubrobacteraceae bacterium]
MRERLTPAIAPPSPDWRVELHRRALAALAEPAIGVPDLARLAHHAEAAADRDAVLRFAPAAAVQAAAVEAHREAADQYARALRFAQAISPVERADLLERFADECFLTDLRQESLQALEEALAIRRGTDDSLKLGETQRLRARLLPFFARRGEARAAALEAAALLEHAPPGRELARTYARLAEISMHGRELDATMSWGMQAIELAAQVGDTEALVHGRRIVGVTQLLRGLPGGREKLERSIAIAKDAGLHGEVGEGYVNLAATLSQLREWPLIDPVLEAGIDYCREHGLEVYLAYLTWGKAEGQLVRGRWSEAAETATSLLANPPGGLIGARYGGLLTLALVRVRRGDPEYWPLLDEALALAQQMGELLYLAHIATARAEAAWLEGRPEAIAAETDEAFELATGLG